MMSAVPSRRTLTLSALSVLAIFSVSGCEKKKSEGPAATSAGSAGMADAASATLGAVSGDAGAAAVADSSAELGPELAYLGTVHGTVKLKPGARLPLAPPIVGPDGKAPMSVNPCPPVDAHDRRTISVHDRTAGLSPAHVAITGMTAAPKREARVHELFIDGCRQRPTMIGA